MIEFTKEQLKQYCEAIIAQHEAYALPVEKMPDDNQALVLMAKTTLASLTAEPVFWVNGCDKTVPAALRFLAEKPRPIYGNSPYNTEHLYQLAREIEQVTQKAPPAPVSIDERAEFNAWNNDIDCPLAGLDAKKAAWLAWSRRAAMLQGAEPKKYNIGEATMRHIFTPAGITNVSDLQAVFDRIEEVLSETEARCAALAAENAGLKECTVNHAPAVEHWNAWADAEDKIPAVPETPATDAFRAELRAQGVEMAVTHIEQTICPNHETILREFAAQLRKGVQP